MNARELQRRDALHYPLRASRKARSSRHSIAQSDGLAIFPSVKDTQHNDVAVR